MRRKDFLAVAALAAAVLALTAPVWARPGMTFFNHGDLYAYHWPLRHHSAAALVEGRLPFWNPYVMLGVPHAANPQAVLFYPGAILGFLFPVITSLVWDTLFHLLWAGLGAFLLARASRLPRAGALALAAAYALSPFLVYRVTAGIPTLTASLSWAPWIWFAWLSGSVPLLAASWALQFLSGHPQFLLINAVGMALWAAAHPARLRLWKTMALGAGGSLVLAAAQWLPMLELLRGSNRSGWAAEFTASYSLEPMALLMWLSPGALGTPLNGLWDSPASVFYESGGVWLGVCVLALAVAGIARGRVRLGAALLLALGTLLALGANGPFGGLLGLPGFSYLRTPSRWSFLVVWALWLLAGQGLLAVGRSPRLALIPILVLAELAFWDAGFLTSQDSLEFTRPNPAVAAALAGRDERVLTDPALANPNKAIAYRMRNANGYDAFYPGTAAVWAALAEGAPAADSSRVLVSRWRSEASSRAGIAARLSAAGVERRGDAWPLAAFVDEKGKRLSPDPALVIKRPELWLISATAPKGAVALALAETRWPGWRATVNGSSVPLDLWGPAFQSVRAYAGQKMELRLEFQPSRWFWWVVLSLAAWAAWLAAFARRAAEAA